MVRLVVEQGIQATPMSQLAKQADVAAGTIYHHFPSKEVLLNELYLELKKNFGEALMQKFVKSSSYRQKFELFLKNIFHFYKENEQAFLFSEQITRSTIISEETRGKGEEYYTPAIEFLIQGMKEHELKEMDIELMSNLLYSNIAAALHLHHSKTLEIDNRKLDQVIESSWEAVKYRGGGIQEEGDFIINQL